MFIQRSTFCSLAVNLTCMKRKIIRKDWFIAIGWPISGFIWGIIFTQFNVRHPNNKTHGKRLQDIFYINIFFNTISCQILWERIFLLIFKWSWIILFPTFQQEFNNIQYYGLLKIVNELTISKRIFLQIFSNIVLR